MRSAAGIKGLGRGRRLVVLAATVWLSVAVVAPTAAAQDGGGSSPSTTTVEKVEPDRDQDWNGPAVFAGFGLLFGWLLLGLAHFRPGARRRRAARAAGAVEGPPPTSAEHRGEATTAEGTSYARPGVPDAGGGGESG